MHAIETKHHMRGYKHHDKYNGTRRTLVPKPLGHRTLYNEHTVLKPWQNM